MAAPDKSLRPKSRPDESNERKASEAFGDLEFRADLDETLKDDPISRLGFTLTKDSTYFGGSSSPNMGKSGNRLGAAYSGRHNEVFMSDTYGSSKDAYSHEYRHAGFDVLRKLHNEDPVAFENMYGKDAALLLDKNVIREELVAELLDNPDASYMSEGKELPLSDTIQYVNPEKLRDAKEKGYYSTDSFRYGDIYTKGVSGLKMAAQDLLFESGEPSKYQDLSTGPKDRKGKRGAEEEEGILSGFFKRIGFNEGGSVGTMDAQMKLFEEGGLTDDGTTMDPVSGNEVPPGSLPEEVRDDIPAQLSEGEYVVPADVVRYYGVKFFEDLRSQAKMGWSEMERNGRVGGEPMAPEGMEMGGDDFPFSLEELQVVEAAEGGYIRGYADGGLVDQSSNPFFNSSIEDLVGSADNIASSKTNKALAALGAATLGPVGGIVAKIGLQNAQRNQAYDMLDAVDMNLKNKELTASERERLSKTRRGLERLVSTADDGKSDTGLIGKSGVFGGKSSMYEGLKDVSGSNGSGDGRVNFGDTWLGDTLGFDGKAGTDGPGLKDSLGGARREEDDDKE